jgi:hypothetical protein
MSERITTDEDGHLPYGDERGRIYKAAGGGKRCLHLMFVPARGEHDLLLPFTDIRRMELRKDGRELLMEFSEQTVIVTGSHLRSVASAIGAHMCSRLEAFDAARRDRPGDDSAPFIERIAFHGRDDLARRKPAHEPETAAREKEKLQ